MSDLISRKALLDKLTPWLAFVEYGCGKYNLLSAIVELIRKAPAANDWISVKDRLPEQNQPVFVAYKYIYDNYDYYVDKALRCNEKDWCWYSSEKSFGAETIVTHWMPLPSTEGLD